VSRIVTFYSYKGGVGRTLALANIGVLLAKQGKKVLLMDWDLEAPGLDRYFRSFVSADGSTTQGIAHLLNEATADSNADWHPHVQRITVVTENVPSDTPCTLSFIPSGVASGDYSVKVRSFSWPTFMEKQQGGMILDRWRDEWKNEFDFILIDSRTGVTDAGGICTVLLPDLLVLVFTANDQSFEGAMAISQSAQVERRNLAVQRPRLAVLPLLSRFDGRVEIDIAESWLKRFDTELKPFYNDWLPIQFQPRQILELTKIPYVTRFSFGEPLPVVTHSLTDPELPGFYFENVARLLASDFQDAALIIDPEATKRPNIQTQILTLIQQTPLDEVNLTLLLRTAEDEFGESDKLSSLLSETGTALVERARFKVAEPLLRRALALDEKTYGPNHGRVAAHLNNLGELLHDTGRLGEAELLLRRALKISEQTLGLEHRTTATRLNNLAALLHETNRLREAEPLLRRALAIDERSLGPEHPDVAIRLNNLAQLLMDTNRYDEAEQFLRRALTIYEQNYGPKDPKVARILTNLAGLLNDKNRMTEAEPLIRQALAIDEASYGPNHPTVAIDLNNLANSLYQMNNFDEAEPLMRRTLAINEQSFGPTHSSVANSLSNLALLLEYTGRTEDAEPLIRRALSIEEQNYGNEHPSVALRLVILASLLSNTNRSEEAEPLARQALNILVKFTVATGHEHSSLLRTLEIYTRILREIGQTDEEIKSKLDSIGMGLPLSTKVLQDNEHGE
jgi:tetratricopeptide (TPR) repeat protein/cellulose biosynthesis protein BcsQ